MGQVLAIDFGKSRCGIAATDDMQIIASGLDTVETQKLITYLEKYISLNNVEVIVVGKPTDLKGNLSEVEQDIQKMLLNIQEKFPSINLQRVDERFTSKIASYYISQSGKSKKERQNKGLIDKVSATLILQTYLDQKK